MDFHGLVAANLPAPRRPAPASPRAEQRYWQDQSNLPSVRLRPLLSLATAVSVIVLLIGAAQA
jgi:hypothetical protein